MEAASTSNERTPLIGNVAATNSLWKTFLSFFNFSEETPLDGNSSFNEQEPLGWYGANSNEHSPSSEQGTSNSDTKPVIISCETNEVSLEEIVPALCSAWKQNIKHNDYVKLDYRQSEDCDGIHDYFNKKQLYAMRLAWNGVVRERRCADKPHAIAEALGVAIAKELLPEQCDENDFYMNFHSVKNVVAYNFLRLWFYIVDEDDEFLYAFPVRYIETVVHNPDEQQPVASKFWIRQVELYDKVHDFVFNLRLQLLLHSLLFVWPLSFLIIGSKYMQCPMGHHLSPLMMVLGCLGCLAVLYRLALVYMSPGQHPLDNFYKWKCLLLIELTFLAIFFVQGFHFFYIDLKTEPNHCVQDFYNAALVINYISIPLVSVYMFAYSIIFFANWFNFWPWLFRHL